MLCLNTNETNEKLISFKLQNLDPSLAFKNINSKGKFNFLFTSGTLAPFDSWSEELKMNFDIKLDNKHEIDPSKQIAAFIIESGPDHKTINFTHEIRKNAKSMNKTIREVGKILLKTVEVIPNGMIAIFASHTLL